MTPQLVRITVDVLLMGRIKDVEPADLIVEWVAVSHGNDTETLSNIVQANVERARVVVTDA